MPERRQRWTKGAVVAVPLGEADFAFGQMLEEPEYVFFALRRPEVSLPTPEEVVAAPVLFRLWVMRQAHAGGRWSKMGQATIAPALAEQVLRFNQDPLRPTSIVLTYDGVSGTPCDVDACKDVERAAVWDPSHVEDRLRDHFAGRQNRWEKSLRVRSTA
jgi:hypothetical protein